METHSTADDGGEVPRNDQIDAPAHTTADAPDMGANAASAIEPDTAARGDDLDALALRAKSARLTADEEDRAIALLKQSMLDGKNGAARVSEIISSFSWLIAVRGVETVWGELKPAVRTQFLKGLADQQSDPARRIRLSLARALFKQDVPAALKIAAAVAREMIKNGSETITLGDAQVFSNVFIGKAKPWITQLRLEDLKSADAEALVSCAIVAAFAVPHPPPTQLGILKWAQESGRLEKLAEPVLRTLLPVISRWSGKWRAALTNEIQPLPEIIAAVLAKKEPTPSSSTGPSSPDEGESAAQQEQTRGEESETTSDPIDSPTPERKERPIYQPRPQKAGGGAPAPRPREGSRERPVYQPRSAGGTSPRDLNVSDVLRQVDAHVAWLRSELQAAQAKLRDDTKQPRRGKSSDRVTDVTENGATFEELARTNVQLEARIAELQMRIDDLLADAEDRAASLRTEAGEGAASQDAQLRALLALKLQESFADFSALEKESPSVVVQQHYRSVLQEVFAVLRGEGVQLEPPH
jgi:hypothetical protein